MECRRCKQEKKESNFNWKIKANGIRQTVCTDCVRDQNRKYRALNGEKYDEAKRIKYKLNIEKVRIGRREDYANNKEKYLAESKRWREENKDAYAVSVLKSRVKRRPKQLEYNDAYSRNNRDSINEKARKKYAQKMLDPLFKESERLRSLAKNRQEKEFILHAYGNQCACCGEKEVIFLTLDHINRNGNDQRRKFGIPGGHAFYRFLRKSGYPPGYQVLCFNCNSGEHLNGGTCPHKCKGN